MKNFVLTFLFVGYFVSIKSDDNIQSLIKRSENEQDSEGDYIIQPCATNDLTCIRRYFRQHGRCMPKYGPVPDPLFMAQRTLPAASSNITFILTDAKITGIDGNITSFYINKKTDTLVIAVEMKPMIITSPNLIFRYNRKGKEPIILSDAFFLIYDSLTLTTMIPNLKDLQLAKAFHYPYLDDNAPEYGFGPRVIKSFDPIVHEQFGNLVEDIPLNNRELLILQAPIFMNIYIQSNICNFGLKVEYN